MRKGIFALVFLMLFMCNTAFGAEPALVIDNFVKTDNGYEVAYNFYNFDSKAEYTLITGIYDDERLVDYKKENIIVEPQSKVIKNVAFETDQECTQTKVMVLDSLENMKPVVPVGQMSVTDENQTQTWDFSREEFVALGELTEPVTIDGLTMNYSVKLMSVRKSHLSRYALYLYGGGNLDNCSVKFRVNEGAIVRLYISSSTTDAVRNIKIANKNNQQLDLFSVDGTVNVHDFKYTGTGEDIYVFSTSSGAYIYKIEVLYGDVHGVAYSDMSNIYVDNYENLLNAVPTVERLGGGNVYMQTDYMECKETLALINADANVTIQSAEGYTCVMDFYPVLKPLINTAESVSQNSILVKGSGYTLKNFIIEKCAGSAIKLNGEKCYNNVVENVVSRYNNGGGFAITNSAYNNLLKSCDAYRNCDVYTNGGNADGFILSINAGCGNKAYNCRAWENSDDGFDNFANHNDFYYEECFAWDNGNPNVFTGLKDYNNKEPLDKNMLLVQMIIEQNPEFEEYYNNRQGIKLPVNAFLVTRDVEDLITVAELIDVNWAGNPNGFKLGSGYSEIHGEAVGEEAYRGLKNCIAFDHLGKGVDRNGCSARFDLENVVSFDNKRNYFLDTMVVESVFENAIGFGGKIQDYVGENMTIILPVALEQVRLEKEIRALTDSIVEMVYNNQIPGEVLYQGFEG